MRIFMVVELSCEEMEQLTDDEIENLIAEAGDAYCLNLQVSNIERV